MLSSPIDEIKSRLDVVEVIKNYIKLQKAGVNYRAVCPFHSEKKGSFFVSPTRQIWHCFGCSKGGDMFGFVKEIEGVEFGDALRILAQKAGVELTRQGPEFAKLRTERQRYYEILEFACCFFEKQLEESSAGKEAKEYLIKRGIKNETIKEWRLGYSPNSWQPLSEFLVGRGYNRNEIEKAGLALKSEKTGDYYDRFRGRIMFPVFDYSSQVVGFGARIFKEEKRADGFDEAKYINTPATMLYDKSRILYGLNKAGVEIRKKDNCILVEGYVDAIMLHQAGFKNVVACSGTALTPNQLGIIKRYSENIFSAFDMDIAGDKATKKGIDLAQTMGFNIKIITMPGEKDPADVIFKNSSDWEVLIKDAKTIHDFYFDNILTKYDKSTLEGKKGITKFLLPVIKKIPNEIEKTHWIGTLSRVLNIKEEDILAELQKVKAEEQYADFDKMADKIVVSKQKGRKDLLEEYLAMLSIKTPNCLNFITETDFSFFSPNICKVINHFKTSAPDFKCEPPQEIKDLVNVILLKAEVEEADINFEDEFKRSLEEIRTLVVKDKLDEICFAIKNAEKEKDSAKLQELLGEFNRLSRVRHGLTA